MADTASFDALSGLKTVSHKDKGPHRTLFIVLGIVILLALAVIAAFFTARWYFTDKAAPGVTIGNHSVTGQTADQLTDTVKQLESDSKITIKGENGVTFQTTLKQLGVNVDVDKTVSDAIAAKSGNEFVRINPLSQHAVALDATVDKLALSEFLTDKLVQGDAKAVPAGISFDAGQATFVTNEHKDGTAPDTHSVEQTVNTLLANPGAKPSVAVSLTDVKAPISLETAQNAASEANARLANKIIISNGNAKTFTVPADTVAGWIKPASDVENGTITLGYDDQAISDYIATQLPTELNQDEVDQTDVVDTKGTLLLTTVQGVNGVTLTDTSGVAEQVVNAVTNGSPANLTAPASVTPFATKQAVTHYRIVVDRSTQVATVYYDDQVVKTFLVCTGRTGDRESDLGTFVINVRYSVQTMRGADYVTPNVRWISYYNGGEGFHSAPWNAVGITTGDPDKNGSHGCINMNPDDAKWIFDTVPMGSVVQVVGDQPTSAVRDANGNAING